MHQKVELKAGSNTGYTNTHPASCKIKWWGKNDNYLALKNIDYLFIDCMIFDSGFFYNTNNRSLLVSSNVV